MAPLGIELTSIVPPIGEGIGGGEDEDTPEEGAGAEAMVEIALGEGV